jgi:hypothetical protein
MQKFTIAATAATILAVTYMVPQNAYAYKRPNIMRCPSYPNINNIYNYTNTFKHIDSVICENYKDIINDKKKRNVYLRLRENMVNRNIYL